MIAHPRAPDQAPNAAPALHPSVADGSPHASPHPCVMRHADIKETLIYAPYNVGKGRLAMKSLDEAQAVEMTPEWGGS